MTSGSKRKIVKTWFKSKFRGSHEKPQASSIEAASASGAIPETSEGDNLPTLVRPGSPSPVLNEPVVGPELLAASSRDNIPISDATATIQSQGSGSNLPLTIVDRSQEAKEETHTTVEIGLSQASTNDINPQSESVDCFKMALRLLEPKDLENWKAMQSDLPLDGEADNTDKLEGLIQKQQTTIPGVNTQTLEDSQNAKLVVKKLESFLKIAKPFVMVLSRLDLHGLAPLKSAGSFFAVKVNTIFGLSMERSNANKASFSLAWIQYLLILLMLSSISNLNTISRCESGGRMRSTLCLTIKQLY